MEIALFALPVGVCPQTVCFVATFEYCRVDRREGQPVEETALFDRLEDMEAAYRKTRKRRAIRDRSTGGRYYLQLTAYGGAVLRAYPEKREADADCGAGHKI